MRPHDKNMTTVRASSLYYLSPMLNQSGVTSAEELGTMSKNNLRGITLGIRPIWRIHCHAFHPLLNSIELLDLVPVASSSSGRQRGSTV